MTQQERFEADYLAGLLPIHPHTLFKKLSSGEYRDVDVQRAFRVHQQQAKRHDEEVSELVGILKSANWTLHNNDENGPCLCSQCKFIRAKCVAITEFEGQL